MRLARFVSIEAARSTVDASLPSGRVVPLTACSVASVRLRPKALHRRLLLNFLCNMNVLPLQLLQRSPRLRHQPPVRLPPAQVRRHDVNLRRMLNGLKPS